MSVEFSNLGSENHSVLAKVRRVLETLAEENGRIGLSELSRRSGVSKATVYRLCQEMVEWGVVERAGDGFRLGPRLFELGQRVPARRTLRDAALPYMQDVYVTTRHTVHLAVLDESEIIYVEKISGRTSVPTPSQVAGRMPLSCTATGKVILAFGPPALRERILHQPLQASTRFSVTDHHLLFQELVQVRHQGYATELEEFRMGYASAAAPIFGSGQALVGAMSVTTSVANFDEERLAPTIRMATAGLSRQLGARLL